MFNFIKKTLSVRTKNYIGAFLTSQPVSWILGNFYSDMARSHGFCIAVNPAKFSGRKIAQKERNRLIAQLTWGIYESCEIRFVNRYLPPEFNVIELGGSIGVVSCHILKKLQKNKTLLTVEVDSGLVELLRHNITNNFPECKIEIVNKALAYDDVVYLPSTSTLSGTVASQAGNVASPHCDTITLSKLVEKLDGPYSLVCDIEGSEVDLFLHESDALKSCQYILIEVDCKKAGDHFYTVDDVISLICDKGFSLIDRYGRVCAFKKI